MAKAQKQQLIDEITKIYDKCNDYHNNELKALYEAKAITGGSYWYLLNIYENFHAKKFFGLYDNEAPMFGFYKRNRVSVWEFKYTLEQAQKLLAEIEKVIETGKHE